MSEEKQIDYKEFARQMRQVATVFNGAEPAVVCSKELWESIAGEIESFAGYRKQSDWISVEERLPEEDTIVLVWCGECSVYNYLSDNLWYTGYCDITTYEAGVTHWMPLPEPPKMKGGAE